MIVRSNLLVAPVLELEEERGEFSLGLELEDKDGLIFSLIIAIMIYSAPFTK